MVFTPYDLSLRDKENLKFEGAPTGSQIRISAIIAGSITIGSVSATVDSVYIQSGNNVHLGSAWENIGSVLVSNPSTIGSIAIQTISGVITVDNRVGGSIVNLPIGSNFTLSSPGSIGVFITAGSVSQVTDPWRVTGSVNSYGVGSIRISEWGTVGSFIGSVYQLTSPWVISGTANISGAPSSVGISGAVNQGTSPWVVSGTSTVAGSVFTTGSINIATELSSIGSYSTYGVLGSVRLLSTNGSSPIYNSANPLNVENDRGVFNYSGQTFIASGTANNIITPGTGSKIMLKGFNASAQTATQFRLLFSGGNVINTFNVPNSGTVSMNMMGMEPSGAVNEPISVGLFNAGSLHLTVFIKNTL